MKREDVIQFVKEFIGAVFLTACWLMFTIFLFSLD